MKCGTGVKAPEGLELVVEIAGVVGLLAELTPDHLAVAHLRARTVAVTEYVERPMKVREPVVDGQEVVDIPLIRQRGPNVRFLGEREQGRIFRVDRDVSER